MDFEAQNSTILIVMMIAGAAFASVGLWLLSKPKPTGSSAKIEIFGLKFESSSAGLLVFLIGAVFLAIPLFVPEKAAAILPVPIQPIQPDPGGDSSSPPGQGQTALLLPADPQVSEVEPNDRIQEASQLGFGQILKGKVHKGEADWYVIPLPSSLPEYVELKIRHVGGGFLQSKLFDARETKKGNDVQAEGTEYLRAEVLDNDRFYVRMSLGNIGSSAEYEIVLKAAADN
jgi:hypothetical protein